VVSRSPDESAPDSPFHDRDKTENDLEKFPLSNDILTNSNANLKSTGTKYAALIQSQNTTLNHVTSKQHSEDIYANANHNNSNVGKVLVACNNNCFSEILVQT